MEKEAKEPKQNEEEQDDELNDLAEELKEEEPKEEKEEVEEEATAQEPEKEAKAAEEEVPAPEKEEEAKPPKEKAKKEEKEIVEERIYTVPLGKALIVPPNKRTARAVRMLKSFMIKHMKLEAHKEGETEEEEAPARLIIDNEVNEKLWSRGIEKPPRKIRVRAEEDKEGNVTVYLAEGD
jgi:large subunit ribosomal protein L31e